MTSMDQIHRIRDLYYGQDKSLTEIAEIEKIDWRTARKYVDMEDFNEKPPSPDEEEHSSKLDPFKLIIDKWLTEDKKAPRKQRHTAKRVHRRLEDDEAIPVTVNLLRIVHIGTAPQAGAMEPPVLDEQLAKYGANFIANDKTIFVLLVCCAGFWPL